jgi:hypothetical protein
MADEHIERVVADRRVLRAEDGEAVQRELREELEHLRGTERHVAVVPVDVYRIAKDASVPDEGAGCSGDDGELV